MGALPKWNVSINPKKAQGTSSKQKKKEFNSKGMGINPV